MFKWGMFLPVGDQAFVRASDCHLWKEEIVSGSPLVLYDEMVTRIFTIRKGGVELRSAA
jgi:hypothetical protein